MFVQLQCPPLPHLVVGGMSLFRPGDLHERRVLTDTFDLIVMAQGTLWLEVGAHRLALGPRDYVVIPPGQSHGGFKRCTEETSFYWQHFQSPAGHAIVEQREPARPRRLNKNKYYRKDPFTVTIPITGHIGDSAFDALRVQLDQTMQVKINNYRHAKEFFLLDSPEFAYQTAFITVLAWLAKADAPERSGATLAEQVYEYLSANLTSPVRLADLARQFAFSEGHIVRETKARYGASPIQLLIQLRLEAAKTMLAASNEPVGVIARRVGFEDPSYFAKQFRHAVGVLPSEYRTNWNA